MHIGVLFYTDTLDMMSATAGVKGRAVANHGLLIALATAADADHRVTVLVSSPPEVDLVRELLPRDLPHVAVVSLLSWKMTEHGSLDVLHLLGPDLYRGLYFRNTGLCGAPIVTGMTHSLSHAPFLDWLVLSALQEPTITDAIICTTPTAATAVQAMQQAVARKLPSAKHLQTPVIPLGIPDDWHVASDPSARAALQLPSAGTIFLSFGRLSHTSKADLLPLILAWRELARDAVSPPSLVLAGAMSDPSEAQRLQMFAKECGVADVVHIVPNPDTATKAQLFAGADACIALSDNYQETFGIAVVEALAAGLPVIASDWNGYRALVDDGSTGWLLPTRVGGDHRLQTCAPLLADMLTHGASAQSTATDMTQLIAAVRHCVADPAERQRRGAAARATAERYRWSAIIPQYFALWEQLCAAREKNPPVASSAPILDHAAVFAHYPSDILLRTDLLDLTATGHALLRGDVPLRTYGLFEEAISSDCLHSVLQLLRDGPRTVASLERELTRLPSLTQYTPTVHLHWLLKYGAVQIVDVG